MKRTLIHIATIFESLPDLLRAYRILVLVGTTIIVGFLAPGLTRMKLDMAMESWFRSDDPAVEAYMRFRDTFGSDNGLYLVYKAKDGDIFSQQSLKALAGVHRDLVNASLDAVDNDTSQLGHILDTKSLINVSYMDVEDDLLISREFIGDPIPDSQQERETLRREALEHKDYPLFYLSTDSQFGGIFIRTDMGAIPVDKGNLTEADAFKVSLEGDNAASEFEEETVDYQATDMAEYARFVDDINAVINKPGYLSALEFYPVGNPVIMKFFNNVLTVELSYILLGTIGLILITLYYLFRSFSAVVWPLLIVVLSQICTLGLASWMGLTMSMMISLIVMMVLVIGVADSVHILSGYQYFRKKQLDHRMAMRAVYKKSGLACLLTSVTTSAGLLSMIVVPIPPIAVFGITAAMGVMIAFVLTVILLPILLDTWQPISPRQAETLEDQQVKKPLVQRLLTIIEPVSFRYPRRILLLFLLAGAASIYGLTQVRVDSNMIELIEEGHPVSIAHRLVDRHMGGTQSLEIFLDFKQQDALKDPKVLNVMDAMQDYLLLEHPKFVVKAESLVNVVKNSFQVLNENREEMYRIPQDQETLTQTLFLFDSTNPEDRQLLVTDDYARGRISLRLKNYGSMEYLDFFADVEEKSKALFEPLKADYPHMQFDVTGGMALMMKLVDYMSWSQIQSFGLALLVITVMLLFVFGSPKIGLMGMIPNLFPVAVTFGAMGFLGIPLDGDTLIIAPVVIGIAVDDTIHFLTHFRTEMLETGKLKEAIGNSIREVGQAISFSTVILVLGFLTLTFSAHQGMAHFGYLTAVAFVSAWLADLFLLPALCVFMGETSKADQPSS